MQPLILNEEQSLLRDSAVDFVAQRSPVARMRALRDAGEAIGFDPVVWKEMADLGWPGILIPEAYGGLGLGYAEMVVVLEELGCALAPEPFLGTVLLGANTLLLGGSEAQKQEVLPAVASGERFLALAHHEPGVRHQMYRVSTRAVANGEDFVLDGEKDLVLDGPAAEKIIVSARTSGADGDRDGITLFLVEAGTPGLSRTNQHLIDTRGASLLNMSGVRLGASAVVGQVGHGADILDPVIDRALVGLSAEMLGGMRTAFEMTTSYLRDREQFGVKIGSFQALKHRAARMFVQVELARSTVMAAARAIDEGDKNIPEMASLAKGLLSASYVEIANEAVQMHGGIGMTDEHDIGFFLKRARSTELLFGDAVFHRNRWAALSGY
ncbi:MAG: acyl-CoA dehydrogenase family protein [Candidatus Binatia bacterium]|nr:acyl-CoA dehydrogenase family protein [Candidatus Binatia bacterium]MDG1959531.1 acyl-CoA dehydrogenase family protein [Candidatus Binatia bacterium]MDG2010408.1 acyl-CoA dehydrogenase family protein [Candidatus Binatia bacterium]HAC79360.1 acyl-CoA dehydrogenase [Deltaproteobacteria bacterium]